MLHQEKVEVRKTQLVFIMMRRKPSYCSGRGRIYSTKACPGVSVQQPVGICLEEQTQPFHWVGRLRKMTISSEDYCSNIALSQKSNFLRPYCLNPCLNRFCLSYLFLLPPSTFVCHIFLRCHLPPLFVIFVIFVSVDTFNLCLSTDWQRVDDSPTVFLADVVDQHWLSLICHFLSFVIAGHLLKQHVTLATVLINSNPYNNRHIVKWQVTFLKQ